jgi:hypothetical protein
MTAGCSLYYGNKVIRLEFLLLRRKATKKKLGYGSDILSL